MSNTTTYQFFFSAVLGIATMTVDIYPFLDKGYYHVEILSGTLPPQTLAANGQMMNATSNVYCATNGSAPNCELTLALETGIFNITTAPFLQFRPAHWNQSIATPVVGGVEQDMRKFGCRNGIISFVVELCICTDSSVNTQKCSSYATFDTGNATTTSSHPTTSSTPRGSSSRAQSTTTTTKSTPTTGPPHNANGTTDNPPDNNITTSSSSSPSSTSKQAPTTTATLTFGTTTPAPFDLYNISNQPITSDNITQVLNETLAHVNSVGPENLGPDDIYAISKILNDSAHVQNLSASNADNMLHVLDAVLEARPEALFRSAEFERNSPQRLRGIFTAMTTNLVPKSYGYTGGRNVAFCAYAAKCGSDNQHYDSQQAIDGLSVDDRGLFRTFTNGDTPAGVNFIRIRGATVCKHKASHTLFSVFRSRQLFDQVDIGQGGSTAPTTSDNGRTPDANSSGSSNDDSLDAADLLNTCSRSARPHPDTPVLSATLIGAQTAASSSSSSPIAHVQLVLPTDAKNAVLKSARRPLHSRFVVGWWDERDAEVEDGLTIGRWTTRSACRTKTTDQSTVTADCDHLTDFALLIDGQHNDPSICSGPLQVFGYVLNGLSIGALLVLLFLNAAKHSSRLRRSSFVSWLSSTASWNDEVSVAEMSSSSSRRRLERISPAELVSLVYLSTLLLFYLSFTLFSNRKLAGRLCRPAAAASYAFLLM